MSKKKNLLSQKNFWKPFNKVAFRGQKSIGKLNYVPDSMRIDPTRDSAFFFGRANDSGLDDYKRSWEFLLSGRPRNFVGKREDRDGHIAEFGGSGSGKSSCNAMQTIRTWRGPIFSLDFKGELVDVAKKKDVNARFFT